MLKKTERVSRATFLALYKGGRKIHSANLTIAIATTPTFHGSVVVSKKVSKLAVVRNTIRRRIYAELQTLRIKKPATYIVMVRPSFAALSRKDAQTELRELIGRISKTA
jgi:ribonuclease P protein component